MIIIRVFSKTLRAKREILKNAKCTWISRYCIWSNFYLTNHLLNVFHWNEKQTAFPSSYGVWWQKRESKSRGHITASCWYTTDKPFVPRRFTNLCLLLTNVAVYDKHYWICPLQVWRRHSMMGKVPADGQHKRYVYQQPTAFALSLMMSYATWWWECCLFFLSVKLSANDLQDKNCYEWNLLSSSCILRFWALSALHEVFCWIPE